MANVYATKSGLWSDTTVWNTGALPASVDVVYTNTFTVTADTSTKVDSIRNSSASGITAGGSFVLANGVSLSAAVPLALYSSPWLITLNPAATATLWGNVNGTTGASSPVIAIPSGSTLNVCGDVYNGTIQSLSGNIVNFGNLTVVGNLSSKNGGQITNVTSTMLYNFGTANIVGNVVGTNYGNSYGRGAINQSGSTAVTNITGSIQSNYMGFGCSTFGIEGGTLNVIGDIFCSNPTYTVNTNGVVSIPNVAGAKYINVTGDVKNLGIHSNVNAPSNPTTYINVIGNLISDGVASPIYNSASTFVVNVSGNISSNNSSSGLYGTSTTSLSVYGNIINAPNGRQAIYAPRYQVFPSASATYTRQAVNGYDSYADYWTSNATFTYPASSDVVLSTVYSNNTLSGSMALPPASAVALGASVGTTTGTASITLEGLLNQPVATLNTPNSIGARLKNVATTQALSAVANSLDFNN